MSARLEGQLIDAAMRSILAQDWPRLASLQNAYPHLLLDPGAPWTISHSASRYGVRGVVTWNAEETAFVVECHLEAVARWIGYGLAEENDVEVVWHGTQKTAAGTWVAQFTVSPWIDEEGPFTVEMYEYLMKRKSCKKT